jgi:hypothetical protein
MQATIWRVPNGMRFSPKGDRLYVAVTFDAFGGSIYSSAVCAGAGGWLMMSGLLETRADFTEVGWTES